MKTPFVITAVCITLLLTSTQLKAQKQDYIINNVGDTIKCAIKLPFLSFGAPRYKTPDMHGWRQVLLKNTNEYYTTANHTLWRKVFKGDGKVVFMKVLENGKISLYEETTTETYTALAQDGLPTTTISTTLYVAKSPDLSKPAEKVDVGSFGLSFKSKRKRIDELSAMMLDNKTVAEKFEADNKFNFKSVRNIIHLYNTGESL